MVKTIMLACAAGMSTSLLVTKMEQYAKANNIEADIFAVSASQADATIKSKPVDIILLGPQVRFMLSDFEKKYQDTDIKVGVIDMADYGMMNGEKVIKQALTLLEG